MTFKFTLNTFLNLLWTIFEKKLALNKCWQYFFKLKNKNQIFFLKIKKNLQIFYYIFFYYILKLQIQNLSLVWKLIPNYLYFILYSRIWNKLLLNLCNFFNIKQDCYLRKFFFFSFEKIKDLINLMFEQIQINLL